MFGKLLLLFIAVPLIELVLFMTLGQKIGPFNTIAIIILTGFLGASLAKTQGQQALHNYRTATAQGKIPHREIIDGLLILIAGAVLITPGFLTDALGFALLIPSVRGFIRQVLTTRIKDSIQVKSQQQHRDPSRGQGSPPLDNGEVIDV